VLEAQQPPPPALDRDAFRLSSPAPPEAAVPVAVAGSAEGDELSWLQYLAEAQQGHAMVDEKAAAALDLFQAHPARPYSSPRSPPASPLL
jgi:hypothetical protein